MTRALPLVLTGSDLPHPELIASRLDGELTTLGSGFLPVDEPIAPAHRAFIVMQGQPSRYIPEQLTAAWIWGACLLQPPDPQFCVSLAERTAHSVDPSVRVREVVVEPGDLAIVGRHHVTTPLRTVIDLARFSEAWGSRERRIARRLLELAGVSRSEALAHLASKYKLPRKLRALARLQVLENERSRSTDDG